MSKGCLDSLGPLSLVRASRRRLEALAFDSGQTDADLSLFLTDLKFFRVNSGRNGEGLVKLGVHLELDASGAGLAGL